MALLKIASLNKYAQSLRQDPGEAEALADDIFIHLTSFFRDPECFLALRRRVLAKLCAKRPARSPLRIWVAGCSTGEEAYTVAMLLLEELGEQASRTKIQIFGTDIQERAVEHARAGIYTEAAVAGVSPARLKRFFVESDRGYQIQKFVRDLCVFARHDLGNDPPFSRLDLISCRNVLIYMVPALQKRVLSIFQYALRPGGYLFLGSAEAIGDHSDIFTAEDRKHRIFLRKPAAGTLREYYSTADHFPEPAVPLRTLEPSAAIDFRKEAEGILLEHYAPPALIVDPDLHIVHFQGDISPYLAPATGRPSLHLLKMVRPEFVVDLRTAIYKARKEGVTVHKDGVWFEHQGRAASVRLEVRPLKKRHGNKQDLLVVFQKVEVASSPASLGRGRKIVGVAAGKKHTAEKAERLERELASTREHLRALIAEHETAQEHATAANQEILSSNEELQTANEELETAKEELQSSNEELTTVNDELQHSNSELGALTHDLSSLLVGVDIPVLVLDADLRVRRFTPVAGTLLNLIPGDLGRPFSNIASNLDVADWKKLFSKVTGQGRFIEREVSDRNGHRYSLRARPYKTSGDKINEGVLMVLLDVDLISRARDEAQRSGDYARAELEKSESTIRALLESSPQSVVAVNADEKIVLANGNTEKMFGYSREELLGQPLEILVPEHSRGRHAEYHKAYFADMRSRPMGIGLDLEGRRKDGTYFAAEIALSAIKTASGSLSVAFVSDITERRRLELAAQAHVQEVQALAASLLTAQEEERRRVSRELHDQICQQLASLAIDIGGLAANLHPPEDAQSRLKALQARVVKASEETRHIAYELHPSVLDDLGLVASLRSLCKEFSEQTSIPAVFGKIALPRTVPREVASCLYRVAQESLHNIAKHASAKHVSVALTSQKRAVVLSIADDGVGFDLEAVKGRGGLGFIGMEERARLVNGKLSIVAQPGHGTRIALEVALPADDL
jgi:two-component system CheB/CheR fusion protein